MRNGKEELEELGRGAFDAILICFHLEVLISLRAKLQDPNGEELVMCARITERQV